MTTTRLLLVAFLAFCTGLRAQDDIRKPSFSKFSAPPNLVLESDITAAGNSGDSSYIPQLKLLLKRGLKDKKSSNSLSVAGGAQIALAKLGSSEELQQVMCEANWGSPTVQYNAVTFKLPYVGGAASVKVLTDLLSDDARNWKTYTPPSGDTTWNAPAIQALSALPKIIHDSPLPDPSRWDGRAQSDFDKLKEARKTWLKWLSENESRIEQLRPSAFRNSSRSTCKKVLSRDRLIRFPTN
jgi:hypothetical protein